MYGSRPRSKSKSNGLPVSGSLGRTPSNSRSQGQRYLSATGANQPLRYRRACGARRHVYVGLAHSFRSRSASPAKVASFTKNALLSTKLSRSGTSSVAPMRSLRSSGGDATDLSMRVGVPVAVTAAPKPLVGTLYVGLERPVANVRVTLGNDELRLATDSRTTRIPLRELKSIGYNVDELYCRVRANSTVFPHSHLYDPGDPRAAVRSIALAGSPEAIKALVSRVKERPAGKRAFAEGSTTCYNSLVSVNARRDELARLQRAESQQIIVKNVYTKKRQHQKERKEPDEAKEHGLWGRSIAERAKVTSWFRCCIVLGSHRVCFCRLAQAYSSSAFSFRLGRAAAVGDAAEEVVVQHCARSGERLGQQLDECD